jgi:hypothetical protein
MKTSGAGKPTGSTVTSTSMESDNNSDSITFPSITFNQEKTGGLTVPKTGGLTLPKTGGLTVPKTGGLTVPKEDTELTPENVRILTKVATMIKERPNCKVIVTGHGITEVCSLRVDVTITHLVQTHGIDQSRLIAKTANDGDPSIVEFIATT